MGNAIGITLTVAKDDYSDRYRSIHVEREIGMADVVTIELSGFVPKFLPSAPVEISMDDKSIFVGEVVDFSTSYGDSEQQQTTKLTAMNLLHRFNRGRQSHKPFDDKDDEQIIEAIAKEFGMTKLVWGEKNLKFIHPVVLWTNQTAMEFLAQRASRYGYHLWCVGKTMYCKAPDLSKKSGLTLTLGKNLASFWPRISSANVTKTVRLKSSNPSTGKVVTGKAQAKGKPPLGDIHATEACGDEIPEETWIVDIPVASEAEADAVAAAQFLRQSLSFIHAEAELAGGNPHLELGTTVEVSLSSSDRFNGSYYLKGIAHRVVVMANEGPHKVTRVTLARDAHSRAKG